MFLVVCSVCVGGYLTSYVEVNSLFMLLFFPIATKCESGLLGT